MCHSRPVRPEKPEQLLRCRVTAAAVGVLGSVMVVVRKEFELLRSDPIDERESLAREAQRHATFLPGFVLIDGLPTVETLGVSPINGIGPHCGCCPGLRARGRRSCLRHNHSALTRHLRRSLCSSTRQQAPRPQRANGIPYAPLALVHLRLRPSRLGTELQRFDRRRSMEEAS